MSALDHAYGALLGLAVGDALGMPTQYTPRAQIEARYGVLTGFEPGPPDNPISRGMPAGHVTDDTDQAIILGELLVAGRGRVDPDRFAAELLAWERRMIAVGSQDLLGPSTRRALALVAEGASPELTGRSGSTNGAAMRVAPVGVAVTAEPLEAFVDAVYRSAYVTHNTTLAIAGASAVAAAVSAGVGGATLVQALETGIAAAELGARRGFYFAGGDVATRCRWALDLARGKNEDEALDLIYALIGTGVATNEAVPAAFAVCSVAPDGPWKVCLLAARLGGDCDTVAAMAGAIMGACHGASAFPSGAVAALKSANPDLKLESLAKALLALRSKAGG
jgi:ADP-ribosylglycohydrolase